MKLARRIVRRSFHEYFHRILNPSQARSAGLYSLLAGHWLVPPYARRELHVSRPSALGDVLLCTAALREARERNPHLKIYLYTNYPSLVTGLPFIDQVRPDSEAPKDSISFHYEHCLPPPRHIARIFAEQIGIRLRSVTPSCVADPVRIARFQSQFAINGKPLIVINRKAGPWTPNKDWPSEYWQELIPFLCDLGTVVEIGQPVPSEPEVRNLHYHDLRGKTSLDDMVAIVAAADLHIGPISGPVHIAAAFQVPSVVIYGGYESPVCSAYPENINLTDQPDCSPCWLRTPCPHDLRCLRGIRPGVVRDAVLKVLSRGARR